MLTWQSSDWLNLGQLFCQAMKLKMYQSNYELMPVNTKSTCDKRQLKLLLYPMSLTTFWNNLKPNLITVLNKAELPELAE